MVNVREGGGRCGAGDGKEKRALHADAQIMCIGGSSRAHLAVFFASAPVRV